MSVITDIWGQLVRRRLWPLALLLVGALVAVPMVLAKDPEVTAETPVANGGGGAATKEVALATEPIVSAAEAKDRGPHAKVLGSRHDIFKPTAKAVKLKPDKSEVAPGTGSVPAPGGSDGGATSPGTISPPSGGTPPADPKPAPKTYPLYSLTVRFGSSDAGTGPKQTLARLTALPSEAQPLLIYLGLDDDHKTAVFLLDASVTAQGDGKCDPTPENCESIRLRVGDTEFFDVIGEDGVSVTGQYQLDLVTIHKWQTVDASKAARSARMAKPAKVSSVRQSLNAGIGGAEHLRVLGVVGRTG